MTMQLPIRRWIYAYVQAFPAPIRAFLLRALVLFVCWKGLYIFFLMDARVLDQPLTGLVGHQATLLLNMFSGAEIYSSKHMIKQTVMEGQLITAPVVNILFSGVRVVSIADSCNGLELFILYMGFILAMPASLKRKTFFALTGLLVIHAVNVLRCAGLGLLVVHMQQYFDLAHHYIFKMLVYATIFLLWIAFSRKVILKTEAHVPVPH